MCLWPLSSLFWSFIILQPPFFSVGLETIDIYSLLNYCISAYDRGRAIFSFPLSREKGRGLKPDKKARKTKVRTRDVMIDFEAGEPNWMLSFLIYFLPLPQVRFAAVRSLSRVQLFVTPWTAAYQVLCPPLPPRASSNSRPLSQRCYLTISASAALSFTYLKRQCQF